LLATLHDIRVSEIPFHGFQVSVIELRLQLLDVHLSLLASQLLHATRKVRYVRYLAWQTGKQASAGTNAHCDIRNRTNTNHHPSTHTDSYPAIRKMVLHLSDEQYMLDHVCAKHRLRRTLL
jgi:hypothetical protein